jgi:hypothetical protein
MMAAPVDGGLRVLPGLPYVFVIDLDGTIVGRVDYQSQRYTLNSVLRQSGYKAQKQEKTPAAYGTSSRLVRPGLVNFMREIYTLYGGKAFFFLYTASEKQWAHQQIKWIEKTHGIKFARPLFTRDDCIIQAGGNIRKSLTKIWPRIARTLSSGMTPKERMHVLDHQTILIDNNSVYLDHSDKLLLCPDYDYLYFENLLEAIPAQARKHPNVDRMILSFINQGLFCPHVQMHKLDEHEDHTGADHMHRLAKQYNWLAQKCAGVTEANKPFVNDKFWSLLRKLIVSNEVQRFTPSVILQLQNTIWKTMKKA